tara:strand:- start:64 stop:813 length:750 start_codon:yes stop_codon:yes gene_type:complete
MEKIALYTPLIIILLIITFFVLIIRSSNKKYKSIDLNFDNYKNPKSLNKIFKIILYTLLVSQIIYFIAEIFYLFTISTSDIDLSRAESIEYFFAIYATPFILITVVGFIFAAIWIYRANYNVRCLGATRLIFTPGTSVIWYFVPIANLWKPYQAMKEIFIKSHNLNENVDKINNAPSFFALWWFCWIVGNIITQAESRLILRAQTIDDIIIYTAIGIISSIILLVNWFLFFKIVNQINMMQNFILNNKS